MTINYINKSFQLSDAEGRILGNLTYEKGASNTASATTQYAEFFDFKSKGFWQQHIAVERDGKEIASLKMNWKGSIIIDIKGNDVEQDYLVKSVGLWQRHYALQDRFANDIIALQPHLNWKSGNYHYKVEVNPDFQNQVDETLILIATYCANYIMGMTHGVAVVAV
jgi:hypothetical protein